MACARSENGSTYCWGSRKDNGLGRSDLDESVVLQPQEVETLGLESLAMGWYANCGTKGAELWCWGNNGSFRIAGAEEKGYAAPENVHTFDSAIVDLSLAEKHGCAVVDDGDVFCWGENSEGQVGQPAGQPVQTPTRVESITGAQKVATGWRHTCILDAAQEILCWGAGWRNGRETSSATPMALDALAGAADLAAGHHTTCALVAGRVYCWGIGYVGQLGNGKDFRSTDPLLVSLGAAPFDDIRDIEAGPQHFCAIRGDEGEVWCWGHGVADAVVPGQGGMVAPSRVAGISGAESLTLGEQGTCATTSDGTTSCWGRNVWGLLRDAADSEILSAVFTRASLCP